MSATLPSPGSGACVCQAPGPGTHESQRVLYTVGPGASRPASPQLTLLALGVGSQLLPAMVGAVLCSLLGQPCHTHGPVRSRSLSLSTLS